MKAAANRGGNVPQGVLQEASLRRKPRIKRKGARFDTLVARYYPAVYSFACRLSEDPREAVVLTHQAFTSTQKQLRSCCDENVFASIVMSAVIRAGALAG
jgi:hypothetical protein